MDFGAFEAAAPESCVPVSVLPVRWLLDEPLHADRPTTSVTTSSALFETAARRPRWMCRIMIPGSPHQKSAPWERRIGGER